MAFRSQRYHLSRGRVKKNRDVAEGDGAEKKRGVHRCLHSRRSDGRRDGIGVYFMRGLGPLISLILNILWDASGIK